MEIYLIRHTTPAIEQGIVYGKRLEVGTAPSFMEEAEKLRYLQKIQFDSIYSSPAKRCVQLAEYLFAGIFFTDPALEEMDFGDWEGRRWDDVPLDELNPWMKDYESVAPPHGESLKAMRERVLRFIRTLQGERVALFTHGGVIKILMAEYGRISMDRAMERKISFGGVVVLQT